MVIWYVELIFVESIASTICILVYILSTILIIFYNIPTIIIVING